MENNAIERQRAENIQRLNELLEQRRNSNDPTSIHIEFRNADLRNANLQGANLEGANLESVDLEGANLEDANLIHANLDDANLEDANLQDANLSIASVTHAFLRNANLQSATLIETNFSFTELVSANLVGADLFGADLSDSILTRANLSGAHLHFTDFTHADLEDTIFTHASVHRSVFDRANVEDAIDLIIDDDDEHDDFEGVDDDVIHQVNQINNQPRGAAYEVHEAFARFEPKKNDFLAIINQPNKQYGDIYNYIQDQFTTNIRSLFPDDIEKMNEFNAAFNKISGRIGENYKDLIVKSIDYAFSQDEHFKEEYIKAFLDESCRTYPGPNPLSCVQGIIERFTLSIGSAVEVLCVSGCENQTYQALNKLFNPKFDIDKTSTEWWETMAVTDEVKNNMSKQQRKEHYKNYLREKARELNNYNDYMEQEITRYADNIDYSFEHLALGGTRRKTRNSKKSRKTRRIKSRKSKNTIKTRASKKSMKSKKSYRKNKKTKTSKKNVQQI
jgi:uncharacterized protein YjbI with pentapeptide repeats